MSPMFDRDTYQVSRDRFDEAVDDTGELRPAWARAAAVLGHDRPGELADRQRHADRLLDAEGAGHLVHELAFERGAAGHEASTSRPWRIDPIPLVIDDGEFQHLADAVAQRLRLFDALVADLYGERRLIASGVIPASTVFGLPAMQTSANVRAAKRWVSHFAVDVARLDDGTWRIVQDRVDAPSGLGYGLLNRSVMGRLVPDALRASEVSPIAELPAVLRRSLAAQAPAGRRSPRTVVLTGGPAHPTYVEHSYLAVQMGVHLVQGGDLVVRKNRLWLRVLDGVEPVDVVYRRLEDMALDPLEGRVAGMAGVPALTWAAHHGGVTLANGFGAAVAEAAALRPCLADTARALLDERLLLEPMRVDDVMATTPVYAGADDAVVAGRVVVRLHAVWTPDEVVVMRGGIGRVLAPDDRPDTPTAELAKDVWVVGGRAVRSRPVRVQPPPQVDFGSSVPKRAADALYWMGRAAERAEVGARTARFVADRLNEDPSLATLGGGAWADGALALLRSARGLPIGGSEALPDSAPMTDRLHHELRATHAALARQIGSVVQGATSVREFLSTTTGRVLERLARVRTHLLDSPSEESASSGDGASGAGASVDDLDVVLVDLAALAGLAMESTVRGPAWRFLDLGRRIERSLAVVGSIEAAIGPAADPLSLAPLAEAVLSVNESLVAYRRRYRSEVELGAVLDLLVHDDANPRALAFQLDRLREHVASLAWMEGSDLVHQASLGGLVPFDDAVAGGRRLSVDSMVLHVRGPMLELSAAVVGRWFADPVNPMVMGAR